jgi:hypothetical protein
LSREVHDTHTAARDLFQKLIVAEIADLGSQRRRSSNGRADRLGQALEAVLIGKELAELPGKRRIPGDQALRIRGVPDLHCFQISRNHVIQVRIWRQLICLIVIHRSVPLVGQHDAEGL